MTTRFVIEDERGNRLGVARGSSVEDAATRYASRKRKGSYVCRHRGVAGKAGVFQAYRSKGAVLDPFVVRELPAWMS